MTAPTPVVTMDARDHVYLDGHTVGYVSGNDLVTAMGRKSAAELHALADFLDQLAGANLLSSIREPDPKTWHRVTKGCDCSQCYGAPDDGCQDCGESFESPGVRGICAAAHQVASS